MSMLTKHVPLPKGEEVVNAGGFRIKDYKEVVLTEKELLNDIAVTNRRISSNVAFFFWSTIVGWLLMLYILSETIF